VVERAKTLISFCAWTEGVPTLLPKTDLVVLVKPQRQDDHLIVPWSALAKVVGPMLRPEDMYPTRFRVKEFPSDGQLKQLGSVQVKLK
jgi:hypothetical protein